MSGNGSGPLRTVLEAAATADSYSMSELTVLSQQIDPYRFDTASGHTYGQWFADVVAQLVGSYARVHLRGLHYRLVAAGDVLRPDKPLPYINTEEAWQWLSDVAAKAGRWLGYVPFERIMDERNAAPEIFVPEIVEPVIDFYKGSFADIPDRDSALPCFWCNDFTVAQPYRIILIGEKTSLGPVLLPIAREVGGELLLPTGEASDTMVAQLAARCAADGRPAVVFYCSDFDPAGRQMPISVARKLQALRDLSYPDLQIEVHAVALTLEQVRRLELPSSPLKQSERRSNHWRAVMHHEQTEIDALAALNPRALVQIVEDALAPFYDQNFAERVAEARQNWKEEAARALQEHPGYNAAADAIHAALPILSEAAANLRAAQTEAANILVDVESPEIILPDPELEGDQARPLFTTAEDYVTATRRLISHKALNSGVEES